MKLKNKFRLSILGFLIVSIGTIYGTYFVITYEKEIDFQDQEDDQF